MKYTMSDGGHPSTHKFCSHCRSLKLRCAFFNASRAWDGLRPTCKECTSALRKKAA